MLMKHKEYTLELYQLKFSNVQTLFMGVKLEKWMVNDSIIPQHGYYLAEREREGEGEREMIPWLRYVSVHLNKNPNVCLFSYLQ